VRAAVTLEGHAQTAGTHAAGIVVCSEPVRRYCTVNSETATAQIDKQDAEALNLLKIDILGLRTLSVLEYALEHIPGKRIDLSKIPLDDKAAFACINEKRWAGIFQIEGEAIQSLSKLLVIETFSDIVALGALGRPGPLNSQGAFAWCERRMGREPVEQLHPLCNEFTDETYGIVIFQEQVMSIARKVGRLAWADVTEIRKTMAKSKGEEHFSQFWVKFRKGAMEQGIKEETASFIWGKLTTHGAWSFNKSHAVSYGLISYYCAYLKAHWPQQFATATLRYARDEVQTINLLRELVNEGIKYVPFDAKRSRVNWEFIDGEIVGGFLNLKGFGEVTAQKFIEARANGGFTAEQKEKITEAEVMYANIYPAETRYGAMYRNPKACGFPGVPKLDKIATIDAWRINQDWPSEFFFIGMLADKVPRDLNEYVFQVKRVQEGRPKMLEKDTAYLNLVIEDDTGRIGATIGAHMYEEVGREITEKGVKGRSWYLFKGRINKLRRVNITWAKEITDQSHPAKQNRLATVG
jgi:DNA polymerase III alpha subunit